VKTWTEEPVRQNETSRLLIPSCTSEVASTHWTITELKIWKSFHIENSLAISGISKMTSSLRNDKLEHSGMFSGEEESWSHQIVHPEMLPTSLYFDEQIECKKVEKGSTRVCVSVCQLSGENFLLTSGYIWSISSQLFEAENDGWDLKIGWSRDRKIVESGRNFSVTKVPLMFWIVPGISTSQNGQIQMVVYQNAEIVDVLVGQKTDNMEIGSIRTILRNRETFKLLIVFIGPKQINWKRSWLEFVGNGSWQN
jgi:hypothetical protein